MNLTLVVRGNQAAKREFSVDLRDLTVTLAGPPQQPVTGDFNVGIEFNLSVQTQSGNLEGDPLWHFRIDDVTVDRGRPDAQPGGALNEGWNRVRGRSPPRANFRAVRPPASSREEPEIVMKNPDAFERTPGAVVPLQDPPAPVQVEDADARVVEQGSHGRPVIVGTAELRHVLMKYSLRDQGENV